MGTINSSKVLDSVRIRGFPISRMQRWQITLSTTNWQILHRLLPKTDPSSESGQRSNFQMIKNQTCHRSNVRTNRTDHRLFAICNTHLRGSMDIVVIYLERIWMHTYSIHEDSVMVLGFRVGDHTHAVLRIDARLPRYSSRIRRGD